VSVLCCAGETEKSFPLEHTMGEAMPDTWTKDGITYTMNAKEAVGGIVTAERKGAKAIYSRIVSKPLNRQETEKLFEADLTK
jgi:hypothetical protein